MLTTEDLKAIGTIVETVVETTVEKIVVEKIETLVPPIVEKAVEKAMTDPESVINVKFDAIQEQLDGIENNMLTLDKLERYEVGLTQRYDRRYVRKSRLSPVSPG